METILILTDDAEPITGGIGLPLHQIYPTANLSTRRFSTDVVAELEQLPVNALPTLILIDSCEESLPILNELKAHSSLYRIPTLMLKADATQRKAHLDQVGDTRLAFRTRAIQSIFAFPHSLAS